MEQSAAVPPQLICMALSGQFVEVPLSERSVRRLASAGLAIGGVFGIAGTFAPTPALRGIAWGIDGVGLVMASSLLTTLFLRKGLDIAATGFLVFLAGQILVLSTAAKDIGEGAPVFGAGVSLWSLGLILISTARVFPPVVRAAGVVAAILFVLVAFQIFAGGQVTALSKPLPFSAYPVLVATMAGWIWTLLGRSELSSPQAGSAG